MLIFTLKIIAGHQEAGLQDQPSADIFFEPDHNKPIFRHT